MRWSGNAVLRIGRGHLEDVVSLQVVDPESCVGASGVVVPDSLVVELDHFAAGDDLRVARPVLPSLATGALAYRDQQSVLGSVSSQVLPPVMVREAQPSCSTMELRM